MGIEKKDIWQVYVGLAQYADASSWNRFYNFLMFSSILGLAWATVYCQPPTARPPGARAVLALMAIIGLASSVTWSFLGARNRGWVRWYLDRAEDIEGDKDLFKESAWRVCCQTKLARDRSGSALGPEIPYEWAGSFQHLTLAPLAMAFLFFILLLASLIE